MRSPPRHEFGWGNLLRRQNGAKLTPQDLKRWHPQGTQEPIYRLLINNNVASEEYMASKFEEPEWKRLLNKRKSRRDTVNIRANLLVSSGPRFKVSVIDLSRTGFRMETGNFIVVGTKVYLSMPTMQSLQARVAWQDAVYYGCEFTRALHESIFDHIAKQHPSLVR